jgi:hypothetical protein
MKSEFVVVISFNSHNTTFASWHIFTRHNALLLFKNSHNTKFHVVVVSQMPQRVVVVFFPLNERFRSLILTYIYRGWEKVGFTVVRMEKDMQVMIIIIAVL